MGRWQSVQRPQRMARRLGFVGFERALKSLLCGQSHDGVDLWIYAFNLRQVSFDSFAGREFSCAYELRHLNRAQGADMGSLVQAEMVTWTYASTAGVPVTRHDFVFFDA
jgi:hypothetical protein